MEEVLISKKELLALTGISYGALYRWKRKQLIPEEWFIKKSTFTGPETFFPRGKVLERIAKIQEMKEELSLDDLAVTFSDTPPEIRVTMRELERRGLLSASVEGLHGFQNIAPEQELDFYGALCLHLCDGLLKDGHLSLAEADEVLAHLLDALRNYKAPPILTICRKSGVIFSVLAEESPDVSIDSGAKLIVRLNTAQHWQKLKTGLGDNA